MVVYSIDTPGNRKICDDRHYKDIVLVDPENVFRDLNVDVEFMSDKYGFSLSDPEIDQFYAHYFIWGQFYISKEPLCFIVENLKQLNFQIPGVVNAAITLFKNNNEWDIYFPFDPEEASKENFELGYILGYRWGAEGYFLKRSAAEKLLQTNTIRRNVDEEMITMSSQGQFEISYGKTDFFTLIRNSASMLSRDESKKRAIFNASAWTEPEKEKAGNLLRLISNVASQSGIDIMLSYGSLLGQIRHGGIMPWDDDMDFAVNKASWAKLSAALKAVSELGFDIFQWATPQFSYYKVWLSQNENINGYKYSFPFVDIWFYEDESEEIVFDDGKKYPRTEFYPLQDTIFEGSAFKMPVKPMQYLDKTYADWRTKIQIYPWCHKLEKNYFLPLCTSIAVDGDGRMIS